MTTSFHAAAPLLKIKLDPAAAPGLLLDAARLTQLAPALRAALDLTLTLAPAELDRLCACDWCHLIGAIIVAVRISLPLAACPLFDAVRARSVLQLGAYFAQFGRDDDDTDDGRPPEAKEHRAGSVAIAGTTGGSSSSRASSRTAAAATTTPSTENGDDTDSAGSRRGRGPVARKQSAATCASAFRIILRSLKTKYEAKVATAEAQTAAAAEMARASLGCPMVDGSLTDYLALWDGQGEFSWPDDHPSFSPSILGTSQAGSGGDLAASAEAFIEPVESGTTMQQPQGLPEPLVFDDLWATMTTGWTAEDILDMGSGAQQGPSELL